MNAYELALMAFFILLGLVGLADMAWERLRTWWWERKGRK